MNCKCLAGKFKDSRHGRGKFGNRLARNAHEKRMMVYPQIVRMAKQIIAEGLSEKVIQPGITTTDDVLWWYRDRITNSV
jgi:hypothetical protein